MSASAGKAEPADPAGLSLANWMLPPYNLHAFQRVGQLVPSAQIRGAGASAGP